MDNSTKIETLKRWILFIFVITFIVIFFILDLEKNFSLEFIKAKQKHWQAFYNEEPFLSISVFFIIYVIVAALSLPIAALLTLLAGALFDFYLGLVIASFASSLGALAAFLITRYIFKDWVQNKYQKQLIKFNQTFAKEGLWYLLSLRLIPVVPFFLVNVLMAIMPISAWSFYFISQLTMLIGTAIYVYAGLTLANIDDLAQIFSLELLIALTLIGIFPLVAKKILTCLKSKKSSYDYNIIIIGAGAAGLVSAYIASHAKAKVALIEAAKMGGDCLNRGCVPSKALITAANMAYKAKTANKFGFKNIQIDFDFTTLMQKVHETIAAIAPHDSVKRYESFNVKCIKGQASIQSAHSVLVNNQILTSKAIIIATGSKPFIPSLKGLELISYLSSDSLWQLQVLPKHLLILGGGTIACEMAQAFARLGSKVSMLYRSYYLLSQEDKEVSKFLEQKFTQENITLYKEHKFIEIIKTGDQNILIAKNNHQEVKINFDKILIALGRRLNITNLGLEKLGVNIDDNKIQTNTFLQTNIRSIFACGDAAGGYHLTHAAANEAWFATMNALLSPLKFSLEEHIMPYAIFTQPNIAKVGLSERQAKLKNIAYDTHYFDLSNLDRAIIERVNEGFIKVLTAKNNAKILGVLIVGEHAAELLAEFTLAMKHGIKLNKILNTIHLYPSFSEANKYVAGVYKKKTIQPWLFAIAKIFHRWQRKRSIFKS